MRRFLALSLIVSLLANQAASVVHSHAGANVAEPDDHSARPHIHLSGHSYRHSHAGHSHAHPHHHGHKHKPESDKSPALQPVSDHDSDALYAANMTLSAARAAKWSLSLQNAADSIATAVSALDLALSQRVGDTLWDRPPRLDSSLPIFLRTHRLRC